MNQKNAIVSHRKEWQMGETCMEDGKNVTGESKNTLNNIYYFINNMEFSKALKITAICNNTKLGIR